MVGTAVKEGYDTYIAPTGFGGFLDDLGFGGQQAKETARTLFGATKENPLELSDMPSGQAIASTSVAAGKIGAASKVANIPMGTTNKTYDALQRPGVRGNRGFSRIQTVGIPRPNIGMTQANIKLGSSKLPRQKVKLG